MCNHLKLASLLCLLFNCHILVNGVQDGDIRLVNSGGLKTEGRVEIYHSGIWGTVCDDQFSDEEAKVICRQLGFQSYIKATHRAHFGEGEGRIWMDGLKCRSDEEKLSECRFNGWGINDCKHKEDAGVECLLKEKPDPTTDGGDDAPDLAIRLSCPPSNTGGDCNVCAEKQTICSEGTVSAVKGIVEVQTDDGVWYPISSKGWSETEARVVCGQLGYPDLIGIPTLSKIWPTYKTENNCNRRNSARCTAARRYKRRLQTKVLDTLDCLGIESNIGQCSINSYDQVVDPTFGVATVNCGYKNAEKSEKCFGSDSKKEVSEWAFISNSAHNIHNITIGGWPRHSRIKMHNSKYITYYDWLIYILI